MNPETNKDTPPLWALLVGIDEYKNPAITPLKGCVNDVEASRLFLMNQLGVPEQRIHTLTNWQATRANILAHLQDFLINNPDIKPGEQILFHYSGHGSRMKDPTGTEPNGYYETLVAHDSRTEGVYDIPDKTLGALLDMLTAGKGGNVTVILDSCHSGSGTREFSSPGIALTRDIPADERIPPLELDKDLLKHAGQRRNAGPSGWLREGMPYVLLAACRDTEKANEYWVADDQGQGTWQGALNYFVLQELRRMTTALRYDELHERVATKVNIHYPEQAPQCEGRSERAVFGSAVIRRDPFITVQKVEGNTVTLNAGLIHGLQQGAQLELYSATVRTRDELPAESLATVEVTAVQATTAQAEIQQAQAEIPLPARGVITKAGYASVRQSVALQGEGEVNRQAIERLRQAIQRAAPGNQPSPYLTLLSDPSRAADLRVVAAEGRLSIYNANDELLVEPEDITGEGSDAAAVCHALETIARYRAVNELSNQNADSQLAGKIKVRLKRYLEDAEGVRAEALPEGSVGAGGALTLTFDPKHPQHNEYIVEVVNESSLEVYPHIFCLNPDYSVTRIYPNHGQEDVLQAGGVLKAGLQKPRDAVLKVFLPEQLRWDACRDYLKVIATTEPADLEWLIQGGLKVPPGDRGTRSSKSALDQLLEVHKSNSVTRFGAAAGATSLEDWATADLPFTVVRDQQTVSLSSTDERVTLSDGLSLEKPPGFQGKVSITTWGQAVRSAEGDSELAPPPGLSAFPDQFQPLTRSGARGIVPSGLVLGLEVDEASRRLVSPDTPLRLHVPPTAGEEIADWLPVAFDGEDYLPVGYGADAANAVDIVTLPEPRTPAKRGLGRTLRLFVYKKLGRYTELTGLRCCARSAEGEYVHAAVDRNQFKPSDKVALLVHGFNSDTRWMLKTVAPFLRDEVLRYDHILTWDYETFGTRISRNGADLALALKQQCGFGPDDGIGLHVYAHSMGSVVARCMIELSEGHRFVDRLVMAGPPNRGITLATMGRGRLYLLTLLLNRYSAIPPVGAINWVVKQIYKQGVGPADLAVDSDILSDLNARDEPGNVPYLVLAGENLADETERSRFKRIAQKVLDKSLDAIFGEQNDLVIGLSSLRGVRGESYPKLNIKELPCHHFNYYEFPEAREMIKRWINA